jgi:hypothetical protein
LSNNGKDESYEDVMKEYDRLALMDVARWGAENWLTLAYRVVGKLQKLGQSTRSNSPGITVDDVLRVFPGARVISTPGEGHDNEYPHERNLL